MQVTAEMILTDFGAKFPLDRQRRDALAAYARKAAGDARSKQKWVEKTWDLTDYEAKDLLKGKASEAVWERIIKHRNGGWKVVIPIMGSIIGQSLDAFIASEIEEIRHDRAELEAMERAAQGRLARLRRSGSVEPLRTRLLPEEDADPRREAGR